METPPCYRYSPLTERGAIRLIILQPDHDLTAPIQCSLISTTLLACHDDLIENYTALSYVWGDASQRKDVLVDGLRMDITVSLDLALRHIRDSVRTIRVWADALCIDQMNVRERNEQVAQMTLVYETAAHTIIFLGLATKQSEAFIRAVASYGILSRSLDRTREERGMIGDLLEYPWFTRLWTLQELTVSRNPWVQCGQSRCKWDSLTEWVPWKVESTTKTNLLTNMKIMRANNQKDRFSNISQDVGAEMDAVNFLSILHKRRAMGATDPRDFIYANLGMARSFFREAITVDYTSSCSAVFTNVARTLLEWIPDLNILAIIEAEHLTRIHNDLPSWVPDWTSSVHDDNIQPRQRNEENGGSIFRATDGVPRLSRLNSNKLGYRLLHTRSSLLVVDVRSMGIVEHVVQFSARNDRLSENVPAFVNFTSNSRLGHQDPLNHSDEAIRQEERVCQKKEELLYFYSIMLESLFGKDGRDLVLDESSEEGLFPLHIQPGTLLKVGWLMGRYKSRSPNQYPVLSGITDEHRRFFNTHLGTLRAVASLIRGNFPRSIPDGRSTTRPQAKRIHRKLLLASNAGDSGLRIALLSSGSLVWIPENAIVGDECFEDFTALSHESSYLFVRRDTGFDMSERDTNSLQQHIHWPNEGGPTFAMTAEQAGPFRLLRRGPFQYVPPLTNASEFYVSDEQCPSPRPEATGFILLS